MFDRVLNKPVSICFFTRVLILLLQSGSHFPKKFSFICFNESPLKMMKNVFYFISNALFVLKIESLKFKIKKKKKKLKLFGHVEKIVRLKR